MKKVAIITRPRGISKESPVINVRFVSSIEKAYELFRAARLYEVQEQGDIIKLISPSANKFYNDRKMNDPIITHYLKKII